VCRNDNETAAGKTVLALERKGRANNAACLGMQKGNSNLDLYETTHEKYATSDYED
jgi:hypothetical protein